MLAVACGDCHGTGARIDLEADLGYGLRGPESKICYQCHGAEEDKSFTELHDKHVNRQGIRLFMVPFIFTAGTGFETIAFDLCGQF